VLAGAKAKRFPQLLRQLEPDRDRVGGLALHLGDAQLVKVDAHQWHLNRSNGSAHALQRQSALQGVEPKREISSVLPEPQRGHSAACAFLSEAAPAPLGGGAMP